jgi:hypothetical protein
MLHSSNSRRAQKEPAKRKTVAKGRPEPTPHRPDLNRLAFDLAAEWCCRLEDYAQDPFEVTP